MTPRLSVVIATYNRVEAIRALLGDLSKQDLAPGAFEVVVVDDGSMAPVEPALRGAQWPFPLSLHRQSNQGQAAARHHGVTLAQGEIIVIVDDDMRVAPDFLRAHLACHDRGVDVVLGFIVPPPKKPGETRPLFERFHGDQMLRFAAAVRSGNIRVQGEHLATGNVSFRKADYLEVGGFDSTLKRSEDRELGIRFEQAGKRLAFDERAKVEHQSDHESEDVWMRRSFNYGVYDLRIARKHPSVGTANPWRYLSLVHPLSRPVLLLSATWPRLGRGLAKIGMKASALAGRLGYEQVALKGCTLVYGIQYFQGVRNEAGSLARTASECLTYLAAHGTHTGPMKQLLSEVLADHRFLRRSQQKYRQGEDTTGLARDLVEKIGLQMTTAIRLMQFAKRARVPLAARAISRLLRHAYGAEIHWDATVAPGLAIVHGNGLVIGRAAVVGEECILFHNVTLGESIDPDSRLVGAPTLGRGVHVGPGATLLGPIVIGDGSKIMAGAVVTTSIPPGSMVRAPAVTATPRSKGD